jgi:exodeoxyribonuclease VII large subunit
VIVGPVRVQGETCAAEVAAAIRGFNALPEGGRIPRPDVLIVARGGGSLEDLWGFNEEIVARAAAESRIPLIAAVGHETDWTLIDLVADARAPTPTKAAEWAVPKHSELIQQSGDLATRLAAGIRRAIETRRTELKAAARGLPRATDILALPRQRFDAVEKRLSRGLVANTRAHALRLARVAGRLRVGTIQERLVRQRQRLGEASARVGQALLANTRSHALLLARVATRLRPAALVDRIARAAERADGLEARAGQALANRMLHNRRRLDGTAKLLASLSYQSVLARGFAVVRDAEGAMIRSARAIAAGDPLEIELHDGRVAAEARGGSDPGARGPGGGTARPTRPSGKSRGSGQGTLF